MPDSNQNLFNFSERIEASEAELKRALETQYSDPSQLVMIEAVIIPFFKGELLQTIDDFMGQRKIEDAPLSPREIDSLCSEIDNIILKNKALLQFDNEFETLGNEITKLRLSYREELEKIAAEQLFIHALNQNNIYDEMDLLIQGIQTLREMAFPPFGKGLAFLSAVLGGYRKMTSQSLRELAKTINLPRISDARKEHIRKQLLDCGIVDQDDLLKRGARPFRDMDFPPFGKGYAFASALLGSPGDINAQRLIEVAEALELPKNQYAEALKKHGIDDQRSLARNARAIQTEWKFPPYGKGYSFLNTALGTKGAFTKAKLLELGRRLKLPEISEARRTEWKAIMASHGVYSITDLKRVGTSHLNKAQFGKYKGSGNFFAWVVGRRAPKEIPYSLWLELCTLIDIPKESDESLDSFRKEMIANGLTDQFSLRAITTKEFIDLHFGQYGKGNAFVTKVLGQSERITTERLSELAKKLDLPELSEQSKENIRTLLQNKEINNREDFKKIGIENLKRMDFSPFGGAAKFLRLVLKKVIKSSPLQSDWHELADKIDLD